MYRNILFDLYGTLVDIKTDESTQRFWTAAAAFFSRRGARYTCRELEKSYRGVVARGLAANKRARYFMTTACFDSSPYLFSNMLLL
jgi:putative hydrolase of the HAD superfamily